MEPLVLDCGLFVAGGAEGRGSGGARASRGNHLGCVGNLVFKSSLIIRERGAISTSVFHTKTSVKARVQRFVQNPPPAVSRVLSPPIIGCVSGLLLGVSPLARLFLGKDALLGVFINAIDTLGKAYASAALLVLAGSLALPTPPAPEPAVGTDAAAVATKERTISGPLQIASICLVRFILCPTLFLTIVLKAMSRCVDCFLGVMLVLR